MTHTKKRLAILQVEFGQQSKKYKYLLLTCKKAQNRSFSHSLRSMVKSTEVRFNSKMFSTTPDYFITNIYILIQGEIGSGIRQKNDTFKLEQLINCVKIKRNLHQQFRWNLLRKEKIGLCWTLQYQALWIVNLESKLLISKQPGDQRL